MLQERADARSAFFLSLRRLRVDDGTAKHHHLDMLQACDILNRITFHRYQVCQLALFDGANPILPTKELGGRGGCPQRRQWRHAEFSDEQLQLLEKCRRQRATVEKFLPRTISIRVRTSRTLSFGSQPQ